MEASPGVKAKAMVIHLARAVMRRPQVDRILASLSMPAEIIDAVDGDTLDAETIEEHYRPRLMRPHYPFRLNRHEIACFLSHRKCWQTIIDQDLDFGLIIEDDVDTCDPRFPALVEFCLRSAAKSDFVRIPKSARRRPGRLVATDGDMNLFEPNLPGLGMQCQLVGRDAAVDLLKATRWFDRPVDSLLQMGWRHNTTVLAARPRLVAAEAAKLGGTTVQARNRPLSDRLWHELVRPLYRARVARQASLWRQGAQAKLVDNLIVVQQNLYGLGRDANILAEALASLGQTVKICHHGERSLWSRIRGEKLGRRIIHLERVMPLWFNAGHETVLIPNPEWFRPRLISRLGRVDRILLKTDHGLGIFKRFSVPAFRLGFRSPDCRMDDVERDPQGCFHLAGGSFLKGTGELLEAWRRHPEWPTLTLLKSRGDALANLPANVSYHTEHMSEHELRVLQNRSFIHLCPSRAEGWGHYIVEALSCGAAVVSVDAPPMNEHLDADFAYLARPARFERRKLADLNTVDVADLERCIDAALAETKEGRLDRSHKARQRFEAIAADFMHNSESMFHSGRGKPSA